MKFSIAVVLAAAAFIACDSTSGSSPIQPSTDKSLSKTISFSVQHPNSALSTGSLTLSRAYPSSVWTYWILPVTNTSNGAVSFVEFNAISFNDVFSATVETDASEFITGSLMKSITTGDFISSCLQPNETGYIFGIFYNQDPNAYSRVSSAAAQTVSLSLSALQLPKADVQGVGFSTTSSSLSITVINKGAASAEFDTTLGAGFALLRNSLGSPIFWTLLNPTTKLVLAPRDSTLLADDSFDYSGQIADVLLFPLYSDYQASVIHAAHKRQAVPIVRRAFDSPEAFLRALIAQRNSLEAAKRLVEMPN